MRAAIGVTGQFSAVDNLLTGQENLILMADLHHLDRGVGRRRAAELLDQFDLVDAAKKTAMTYSGGMRRRRGRSVSRDRPARGALAGPGRGGLVAGARSLPSPFWTCAASLPGVAGVRCAARRLRVAASVGLPAFLASALSAKHHRCVLSFEAAAT